MKILLPAILVIALLALVVLLGFGLVIVFAEDVIHGAKGMPTILAFFVAAIILGSCTNRVINIIKTIFK